MKNLKKVLALALSATMALSMFVSAGAAFTDAADIKTTEAVDTLVALGVINGNPDGSFKPEATVTRAEMAKMIYVLRTGKDDAAAYASSTTSFTDITAHWAAGYIKYCQSMGIIAGKSATQFAPEVTVTGEEAAKMLLVTLGYNAEKVGLVGTNWAKTTLALADENGMLDDVDAPMAMALPRQYAAQLMFNAVDTHTVKMTDGEYSNMTIIGNYYPTIGEKYMGLKKTVATLESVAKEDDKTTYSLTLSNVDKDASTNGADAETNFKSVAKDYSALKFQQVKVLYKDKDKVYGVYATKDNKSQSAVMGKVKMDGAKVKVDGTKYDLDSATKVFVDGDQLFMKADGSAFSTTKDATYTADASIAAFVTKYTEGNTTPYFEGTQTQVLSTDGNSKMDTMNVTTVEVKKVTYVGSDYVTAGVKRDSEDYNYSSDIKKDDYAVITKAGNYSDAKGQLVKADIVEGKVTGKSGEKVKISDTYYELGNDLKVADISLNATVKLVLVNGYVYIKDVVTAGTSEIALVVETGTASSVGSNKAEARVIFADGTDKVVEVEKEDATIATKSGTVLVPVLATFTQSKGVYDFTVVSADALAGYAKYATGTAVTVDGSVAKMKFNAKGETEVDAKMYFDKTAVVFVQYETDEFKAIAGKDIANWDAIEATSVAGLTKASSGNQYASIAYVNLGIESVPGGSNKTYAYALSDGRVETDSDNQSYTYIDVVSNDGKESTLKFEGDMTTKLGARDAFEFSVDSDGVAKYTALKVGSATVTGYTPAAVASYDSGSGEITFAQADKTAITVTGKSKITKDTVILYVDTDAKKAGGEITIETADHIDGIDSNNYVLNVAVYDAGNDADYITLLVVDVQKDFKS